MPGEALLVGRTTDTPARAYTVRVDLGKVTCKE